MEKQAAKKMEMTPEIMDKIHQCGQEILDVFVHICKENNLRYYLIAGTLLGAVRHKGPIPWDDDIDVCMPRADMEKFKDIMLARPEGETYHIHCFENDPNYPIFIIRLMKKGTLYNAQHLIDRNVKYNELWLDIFPLDNAPSAKSIKYKLTGKRIGVMKRLTSNKAVNDSPFRSLKGNILHSIIKRYSIEDLRIKTENLMQKWNNKDCNNYVSWASHYHFLKQTMPKEWYEPASKLIYNGKYYYVPNKWDKVLTQLYGDYMKPPAEKDRLGHGAVEINV